MTANRRRRHTMLRRAAGWLALAYLAALALIAFWPTPVDRGLHGSISSVVLWLRAHGVPAWLNYQSIEFSANIALFVPVGLLAVLLAGTRRYWIETLIGTLIGTLISCTIELGQLVFLPERFATVNDVIANSLGALLGTLIAAVVLRVALGPAHPPTAVAQTT
ncbi:VanZ family protein [Cryobacterium sp. TMS1-13-1]|uniref:VanZ family protein n=1 Tax=Cryobacterium sp. TMS1-13-1 TaxID=1259220 RepID=UPI00106AE9B4|nr:VanZ family protein [Cryobacterium sp. TMS1-13-1]TFD22102.1 VanZ family protein [Cryobacterium sp. TMS1-13-1]